MFDLYQLNSDCSVPIYQQLVDVIRSDIKSGKLACGTQLPTVRDLAEQLGIARGTIKRSYDELEKEGLVEKVQGRGTFVCYQKTSEESRKSRAMAAIDELLDQLEAMDLSMAQVNIFLNLKLRERAEHQSKVKVAVVECTPEILSQLCDQLRSLDQIDLYSYLLSDVLTYPYKLSEEMDLIVTTQEHAPDLESMISGKEKIAKIALRLLPHSVAQIVKLQSGEQVGILCNSRRFGNLIAGVCASYTEHVKIGPPQLLDKHLDCAAFLQDKDAVLLPEGYEKFCDSDTLRQLRLFAEKRKLILCSYQVDEGSFMYLTEKIERLRERKKI